MALFWSSFKSMLLRLLSKPIWLLLLLSLTLMSLVYLNHTISDLPVAVVDLDRTVPSRNLSRQLDASAKIAVLPYADIGKAINDVYARKLFAVIIIPRHFEERLLTNQTITIPAYGDATSRLSNGLIQQEVMAAYRSILASYQQQTLRNSGFSDEQIKVLLNPINSQTISLFNPGISLAAITFPGLLVMLLQHSMLMAATRVNITLSLQPQGRPPRQVFFGALAALLPIWLFLSIVLYVIWPWLLGYRQLASISQVLLMTLPFLLAVLGLSKLLTECLRRIEMIYLTLSFLTTPVFYLSGTIWPLEAMPDWVHFIALLLPSTWAVNMIAGVDQLGLSLLDVLPNIVVLLGLGMLYAGLGILIHKLRNGSIRRFWPFGSKSASLSDN